MAKLEELTRGATVRGVMPTGLVTVIVTKRCIGNGQYREMA